MDTSHLEALELNLSNERIRFEKATGRSKAMRAVWVAQLEKEVAAERKFLGLPDAPQLSDDDLLNDLFR